MPKPIDAVLRSQPNVETQHQLLQQLVSNVNYNGNTEHDDRIFTAGANLARAQGLVKRDTAITAGKDTIIFDQLTPGLLINEKAKSISSTRYENMDSLAWMTIGGAGIGTCLMALALKAFPKAKGFCLFLLASPFAGGYLTYKIFSPSMAGGPQKVDLVGSPYKGGQNSGL